MKKKIKILMISIFIAVGILISYFLASGFRKQGSVYVYDFTVSQDGQTITLDVGVSSSIGYIRKLDVKEQQGGKLYLDCYAAFGGINGKFGAKTSYTLPLDNETSMIAIYRGTDCYETVLEKNKEGVWKFSKSEPPGLTVIHDDWNIEALKGTYTWNYQNEDGSFTGISADAIHPLQSKDYMTPLKIPVNIYLSANPFAAYLKFDYAPDQIRGHCWSTDAWNQFDAKSERVEILPCDDNAEGFMYKVSLKPEDCVYEIIAQWENREKEFGTSSYSFYTEIEEIEAAEAEKNETGAVAATAAENEGPDNWGISLAAEHITPTGMTVIVNQSGGKPTGELQFGSDYRLKRWNDHGWEDVPYIVEETSVGWTSEAYLVLEDGNTEQVITWEYLYGSLPAGKYMLSKGFQDFRGTGDYDQAVYSVEFEIQ